MKRFVVKPALQLGKRVEPQTAAVDDGEARLDVPLEVADAHTQRCRRLLLIERQTGHLPMGRFPVGVGHAVQTYALRDRLDRAEDHIHHRSPADAPVQVERSPLELNRRPGPGARSA